VLANRRDYRLPGVHLSALEFPALPEAMKSALRFSKASGSTKRRVEKIIRAGLRQTKRALSADRRRELSEGLDCAW
jgi:hypothetical protein